MIKDTCLFPLTAQSLVLQDLEDCPRSQCLNNGDQKQATQIINKTVHQTVPNC
jgi:hypothetical protein